MATIKSIVARNLAELRKDEELTQGALAKMLNYSDKAVSKWECGDSLPDLETLMTLANFYGVTLDYLVTENPEKSKKVNGKKADVRLMWNRIILSSIIVVSVFLIATIVFVYENMRSLDFFSWRVFLWALPLSALALLVFMRRWKIENLIPLITRSVLVWSLVSCVYLQIAIYSFWYVFLVGIPIQILIVLSYIFKTTRSQ